MVKIEVSDAGLPSRPSSSNPLFNRRVQRIFAFAFILITITVFMLYERTSWTTTEITRSGDTSQVLTKPHEASKADAPAAKLPKHSEHTSAATSSSQLDQTRVALIIETRAIAHLPALILNFISTLPPQWIIKHVGDTPAFELIKSHESLRRHIASGKLILTTLPSQYPTRNNEDLSATLTDLTFYRDFLAPAEWLLMFQTDSMICSGSPLSIDDWVDLGYDWIGAPWHPNVSGGNGGFSLRRIPAIVELLSKSTRASGDPAWEDLWLSERLPNCAPASIEVDFSVESFYSEKPLGYHLRGSGKLVDASIWGNRTRRRQIMNYCPEIKIILGIVSLESQKEEQWRLEDEGKATPDSKKNFEEIVQDLSNNLDVDLVKDKDKEQWTLTAKSANDKVDLEAARKAVEHERESQAAAQAAADATATSSAPATSATSTANIAADVRPSGTPEIPAVNVDQSSYGEAKKVADGFESAAQEKAALDEALKADKNKWAGRRRRS